MCNTITSNKLDHSTRDCTILILMERNSGYGTASRWMSPISAEGRENSRLGRGNNSERNLIRDGATSRYDLLEKVVPLPCLTIGYMRA